jgi:hypothetical protein
LKTRSLNMWLLQSLFILGYSLGYLVPSQSNLLSEEQQQIVVPNSYQIGPQVDENVATSDNPNNHYYFVKFACDKGPAQNLFSRKVSKKMAKAIVNEILPISHVAQFTTKDQIQELGHVLYKILLNPQVLMNVGRHYCHDNYSCLERFKKMFKQLVDSYYKVPTDLKLIRDIGEPEFIKYYERLIDNVRIDPSSEKTQLSEFVEFILPCRVVKIYDCSPKPKKLTEEPLVAPQPFYYPPSIETMTSDFESRKPPSPEFEENLEESLHQNLPVEDQNVEHPGFTTPQNVEEREPIILQEDNEENIIHENLPPLEPPKEERPVVETEGDFQDQPPTLPPPIRVELVPPLKPFKSGGIMHMKERIAWLLTFGAVPDVLFLQKHSHLAEKIKENLFLFEKINENHPNCGKGNPIKSLLLWVIAKIGDEEFQEPSIELQEDPDAKRFMHNIIEIVKECPSTTIEEYNEFKGKQPGRIGILSELKYNLVNQSFFSCSALEGIKFSTYIKYLLDDFPTSYGKKELNEGSMRHFIYNLVFLK